MSRRDSIQVEHEASAGSAPSRLRRGMMLLTLLGAGLAATAVQGWQDGASRPNDLRALPPAQQRLWLETRLRELEREQSELSALLARLDAGETIDTPYPLTPPWFPAAAPDWERLRPDRTAPAHVPPRLPPHDATTPVWERLTPEQRADYHRLALEIAPDMRGELEALRTKEPQRYEKLMSDNIARLTELMNLRSRDQDVFLLRKRDSELSRRTVLLAASVERHRDEGLLADAARLEDELRALLEEHFEIRQRLRAYDLDALVVRLRDLDEELSIRYERKSSLVDARFNELLDRFQSGDE